MALTPMPTMIQSQTWIQSMRAIETISVAGKAHEFHDIDGCA
jgi:hypothetical protein